MIAVWKEGYIDFNEVVTLDYEETVRKWANVKHLTMAGNHMAFEDINKASPIVTYHNDGRYIEFMFDGKRACASNFGDPTRLIRYDLRPKRRYRIEKGVLWPDPKGTERVTGWIFPGYRHEASGVELFIGPKLCFYTEPQENIAALANAGQLIADPRKVRFCQNEGCDKFIPPDAGPNAKFCSYECGLRSVEDRAIEATDKREQKAATKALTGMFAAPLRPCLTCGGPIDFPNVGSRAKYCSYECGLRTTEEMIAERDARRKQKAADREAKLLVQKHAKMMKALKTLKEL